MLYLFADDDERMVSLHVIYKRADTGEEVTLEDASAWASYNAQ
jgi:hypothetical protein